jgi:DNA-binding response OmpR family regulator
VPKAAYALVQCCGSKLETAGILEEFWENVVDSSVLTAICTTATSNWTRPAELRARGSGPLEPQVFALLAFLVGHSERFVSRDEILEKVWDGRVVTDSALYSRVKSARHALGDDGRSDSSARFMGGDSGLSPKCVWSTQRHG